MWNFPTRCRESGAGGQVYSGSPLPMGPPRRLQSIRLIPPPPNLRGTGLRRGVALAKMITMGGSATKTGHRSANELSGQGLLQKTNVQVDLWVGCYGVTLTDRDLPGKPVSTKQRDQRSQCSPASSLRPEHMESTVGLALFISAGDSCGVLLLREPDPSGRSVQHPSGPPDMTQCSDLAAERRRASKVTSITITTRPG